MRPEDYQPVLTWWGNTWRALLVLAVAIIAWTPIVTYRWENSRLWFVADIVVGLICFGLVMFLRRRYPVAVTTVTALASVVSATAAGPAVLSLVSLSTRRRWREIIPQAVLSMACGIAAERLLRAPTEQKAQLMDLGAAAVVMLLIIAWGMYIGSRRELLASWQARATLAENEQNARVLQAQSAERARIAREMHDVLAHRISAVSMHAGALAYRDDLPPEQVREVAATIQENSHLALIELRDVLGVLRAGPGDADPEPPQATAADIERLIDEYRRTDMQIDLACDLDLITIPAAQGRTLYRCVQEALTNARKHAPSSRVRISLSGQPGEGMALRVANPWSVRASTAPESGFGLVGLAERVELHGGRQSVTRTDRAFDLEVWLPWQA